MYLSFYKLDTEPFQLTPDPRFLFLAHAHRTALDSLTRGVITRQGAMVLTGAIGTGKTTVLNAMLAYLSAIDRRSGTPACGQPVSSAFIVNPVLTRDEFLENVLDELDVACTSTSKVQRLARLHERLLTVQKAGGTTVLIIDEAHLLSAELLEEVRLLGNFDSYREKLLQIVLCGQSELATVLLDARLRALRQRITLLVHLPALTANETRSYIEQRMRAAGLRTSTPFSNDAILAVHQHTKGTPRLINSLCGTALLLGYQRKCTYLDRDIIRDAVAQLSLPAISQDPAQPAIEPRYGFGADTSTCGTKRLWDRSGGM
jgi:general secretion pathway protein A